jgi:hypothetical protein
MRELCDLLLERRYTPDQPRVPVGNPDGGQWTAGNDSLTVQDALADGGSPSETVQLVAANKQDIRFINYLCRKYGLDQDDRERLHEAITGQDMSREEIEREAQSLAATDDDE